MKILTIPKVSLLALFLATFFVSQLKADPCIPQPPSAMEGAFSVEEIYDETSETWYFITTINHKDNNGELIRLRNAISTEVSGEYVRAFAIKTRSVLAFNASMGQRLTQNPEGEDVRNPVGIQIVDGNIVQEIGTTGHTLGIKADNELVIYPPGTTARAMLLDGARQALTAFIPLIEGHQPVDDTMFEVGPRNYREAHPRQIIAQMENLDLVFLSCGGRGYGGVEGMFPQDVIRILMDRGVKFAFMLDGGGSVSTVIRMRLITEKIDSYGTKERRRPNFLYVLEN